MRINYKTDCKSETEIKCEDYFPLKVRFTEEEDTLSCGFYFEDSDLAELEIDRESHKLVGLQIVLANHYQIVDTTITLPKATEIGELQMDLPSRTDCSTFNVKIYNDGISIILSENIAKYYLRFGKVLFGLSDGDDLVNIIAADMSEKEIEHVKRELAME